jgi:hypothetical protein
MLARQPSIGPQVTRQIDDRTGHSACAVRSQEYRAVRATRIELQGLNQLSLN